MVQRTDFVGDEAPRGAVILNHEDQFVGLLAFLKNGRLHPVFFHNCDFVTSSQDTVKDGGTCEDITADNKQINRGLLNADCSFESSKSLSIACEEKALPGSDDHRVNTNQQQQPESVMIDSGSSKCKQVIYDKSSPAGCSRTVADEEYDSGNESKEPAALSKPGCRESEENLQYSVSAGRQGQNPQEMSGSFDNETAVVSLPANSMEGQFGGIAEHEVPKADLTDISTTESRSSEASEAEESDDLTSSDDRHLFNQIRKSPSMSPRRRSEPHVSRNPTPERCYSLQPPMQVNADSLVSRVIMLNLNILDELARHLDKPISHDGILSCWKQLASYFNMTEDVYQKVNRSGNCGSTEQMFDWFRATRPELTIREIKGVLEKIGRQDLLDIIGSKLQDECVLEDLINYRAPDDDLFEAICLGLDTAEVNGWNLFGRRLGVSRDDLSKFGSSCDAAEEVFKYIRTARPNTTANELKQKLEMLKRKDVSKLLDNVAGDCEIGILMSRHMSTMENVAAQLNKTSTNTNNWRHLAQEYGMSESQILRLEPSCDSSPTKLILGHLTQTNPQMTLEDLLHALVFIQRKDAISALKKYLNAISVDQLVKEIEEENRRGKVVQKS